MTDGRRTRGASGADDAPERQRRGEGDDVGDVGDDANPAPARPPDGEEPLPAARRATPVPRWVPIASYAAVYEAEIGRAVLEAGGFDAIVEGGEIAGIFGPGFSGATPRGVRVLVPSDQLAAAQTYLAFRAREAE